MPIGRPFANTRIHILDRSTGDETCTLTGHEGLVFALAYSKDGARLASGSADHTIGVWDMATGREVRTLEGHDEGVCAVAFSPDGKRLASASWDGMALVWNVDGE